ncbi:hypothetical protein [Pedobacter rhodius]|uniref:Uncharacterized protein n=1 Tax=Pedobacter rhodius TaxID=3004098 RepID=A0ABT4KXS5_9SPHI|nr:hypothetical protein [Pedobacter sp. SJ11]MCZ4223730.1 hypothetical protein [Pedobacter sp. SJ11]
MKKLFVLATAVACFAFSGAKAQNVNKVKLTDINSPYIEISEDTQPFSNKIGIRLEYGQKVDYSDDNLIRDDNGKRIGFNSLLDCANKMKNYGYEIFQAREVQNGKDSSYTKYLLKRK